MKNILIIAGPTASGKTDFAIKLAQMFDGEIISSDSMQIYKSLNIGTAKPTIEEQNLVPHHLIDVANPDQEFSVQQFKTLAEQKIHAITDSSKLPIVVGGTGLYIKSLIYPYSFANAPKDEMIRNYLNKLLEDKGSIFLYELLEQVDVDSAKKIHPNDSKRVIRALEISMLTGQKKSELNNEEKTNEYNYLMFVLSPDRERLYERINSRVDKMFELGLEDEIRGLVDNKLVSKDSQSMQAIGYKEFFDYFDNKITIDEVKELIKKHSRNYAKRQVTFFKSFKEAIWLKDENDKKNAIEMIKTKFSK